MPQRVTLLGLTRNTALRTCDSDGRRMDLAELQRTVDAVLAGVAADDLYAVIGVEPTVADDVLGRACIARARLLHGDRYASVTLPPALEQRMAKAMAEVSRAQSVLTNKDSRKEYDARRALEAAGVQTDLRKIFAADDSFRAGRRLLDRGATAEAHAKFVEAASWNAGEPEFQAFRLWTEYSLMAADPDGNPSDRVSVRKIVQTLTQLTEQHEKHDWAFVFLGHIARNEGDIALAERHYKNAVGRNADNTEAISNLRIIRMRAQKPKPSFLNRLFGKK